MHSQERLDLQHIRSACWLLVDLLDEACDHAMTRGHRVALTNARWQVMDVMAIIRKIDPPLELKTLPGQLELTRDFPA